jgi:hypothetical protein
LVFGLWCFGALVLWCFGALVLQTPDLTKALLVRTFAVCLEVCTVDEMFPSVPGVNTIHVQAQLFLRTALHTIVALLTTLRTDKPVASMPVRVLLLL